MTYAELGLSISIQYYTSKDDTTMTYARILILLLIVVMKVFSGINNQGKTTSSSAGGKQLQYTAPITSPSHTEALIDTLYLAKTSDTHPSDKK